MTKDNTFALREDRPLIMFTHLSQLLDYITGFGGFVVPLILWLSTKNQVQDMDEHGRSIINFQISIFLYCLISIPLIFLFGLGILMLIIIGIIAFVFPIVNAVRASQGRPPHYPLSLRIF